MSLFLEAFMNSIKLPQKRAVFFLNRIRMDITVFYLFIFLAIVSIPALFEQTVTNPITSVEIHPFFLFIYFFIVYYVTLVIIVFIIISIIAFLGKLLAQLLHRKLHYSILWKITAFGATLPIILFTVLSFFFTVPLAFTAVAFIYLFLILVKVITIYPKRLK